MSPIIFLLTIFFFLLGAIIGSFINVVVYRFDTGINLRGRSHCANCNAALAWHDLVPVASYLFLGGHCRRCKSHISARYLIIESITGFLFAAGFLASFFYTGGISPAFYFFYCLSTTLLVIIASYDSMHKIIPDEIIFPLIGVAFIYRILNIQNIDRWLFGFSHGSFFVLPSLLDWLAPLILALPFFLLWYFSRGEWMGFGDAKLAIAIGWLLGLWSGLSAIIFGFWIGALWSLAALALKKIVRRFHRGGLFSAVKKITMKSEIPLGPFLIAGIFLVWIFNLTLLSFF